MSLRTLLIVSLIALSLAFAGCHEPVPSGAEGPDDPDLETGDDPSVPDVEPGTRADISLSASDVPENVTVGEEIRFNVTVLAEGDINGTTDHAGVHWSTDSTAGDDASTLQPTAFDGASPHGSSDIPGEYTVSGWTFDEPGTYHFRAHIIFEDAHYWSSEHTITVSEA